jgi:CheY-like chemotaxis protein
MNFDLFISDISMPGMDIYELIRRFRRDVRTAHIAAIALTGFGRPEDEARARATGFIAQLTKPIRFDQLMRAVIDTVG